jgi:hypothetical protein
MSGPIVRKYGFANYDKIFGERPLQHGVDEPDQATDKSEGETGGKRKKAAAAKPKSAKPKKS